MDVLVPTIVIGRYAVVTPSIRYCAHIATFKILCDSFTVVSVLGVILASATHAFPRTENRPHLEGVGNRGVRIGTAFPFIVGNQVKITILFIYISAAFQSFVVNELVLRGIYVHHCARSVCTEGGGIGLVFVGVGHVASTITEIGNLHIGRMEAMDRLVFIAIIAPAVGFAVVKIDHTTIHARAATRVDDARKIGAYGMVRHHIVVT